MPGSFIDTNVLVYLASSDAAKAHRAEEILRKGGSVSVQVLNELAHVLRRKAGLSWAETRSFLSAVGNVVTIHPVTMEIHETGLALAERYRLSTYDAMIAASAIHADCERLWSEDMQHGMVIDGRLRLASPFLTAD